MTEAISIAAEAPAEPAEQEDDKDNYIHLGHHDFPGGVRRGTARGRADLGSLWPALAGAERLCGVLRRQHLVRARHRPAEPSDRPRHPGRRRLRDLGAVARDRPRSVLRRGAGRAMALIMIAMAAAPGFSPLLGGALDHYFGWRSEFVFVAAFAALGAIAYGAVLGETHNSTRTPLDPFAITKNYLGLIADRRFVVPAVTVSLIMGGLFAMFSAAPSVLIEGLQFSPIELGLFLRAPF